MTSAHLPVGVHHLHGRKTVCTPATLQKLAIVGNQPRKGIGRQGRRFRPRRARCNITSQFAGSHFTLGEVPQLQTNTFSCRFCLQIFSSCQVKRNSTASKNKYSRDKQQPMHATARGCCSIFARAASSASARGDRKWRHSQQTGS